MKTLFYKILKNALWRCEPLPESIPAAEFLAIWRMAREQTVSGLVAEAMLRNNVKTNAPITMMLLAEEQNHRKSNEKVNQTAAQLASTLNEAGVAYIVFKGQTIAPLYPATTMRSPGDIDFYVTANHFSTALDTIKNRLPITEDDGQTEKHIEFYLNGIDCEMHHRLETFGRDKHQQIFDRFMDEAIGRNSTVNINETAVKILPAEENILLVFKHLFNHLLVEGVGLRQVCDLAILLHTHHAEIDKSHLEKLLRSVGYWKAFLAMGALIVNHLGLPQEEFPYPIQKRYNRWADRLLREIERRGNFGKHHRKNTRPGKAKSLETAWIAFSHCARFFPLAPRDIAFLIPKRIAITLNKYR